MNRITIVGLGPWQKGYLTERALQAMESAVTVFRTEKHPEARAAKTGKTICLDDIYPAADSFEELNRALAGKVMELAGQYGAVVYAVPGQGMTGDGSVRELLDRARGSFDVDIIPGVEETAPLAALCAGSPGAEAQAWAVVPAALLDDFRIDRTLPLLVSQIDCALTAGTVKLRLARLYGDTADAYVAIGGEITSLRLCEIDRLSCYDHTTMLYLPPYRAGEGRYDVYDLVSIMDRLRGIGGCPWDREQTHESLRQYLLEECYEVIDAIDQNNMDELCEELGDVLLQVAFHARIASERGDFDIGDVSDGVCRKMISRHPHIFADAVAENAEQVLQNWEQIKKLEKGQNTEKGMMERIPKALPALVKSMKVQDKAARVGFDWEDVWGAYDKLEEEVGELREAVAANQGQQRLQDELGDVLFAAINVARFLHVHPEFALQGTVDKFIRRFGHIEQKAADLGKKLESMTLEEMENYWEEAKNAE